MKEKRRTRRRIQRGGYSIPIMLENIRIINESTAENFNQGRKKLEQLVIAVQGGDFKEAIARSKLPQKDNYIQKFLDSAKRIGKTTDRPIGLAGAQKLADNTDLLDDLKQRLVDLKTLIESISNKVLPPLPASPPLVSSPPPPLALAETPIASSNAAPLPGAPLKQERLGKKTSPIQPLTGELSRIFKKGDKLHSIGILTNPATGQTIQSKTITVSGDYNPDTQSIEVTDGINTGQVTVEELRQNFRVIPQVQKRLFKKGDRVLIKNPRNIEKVPKAIRDEVQQTTCNDPFYATVENDQEQNIIYVKIVCDKGGRYTAQEDELIYVPPEPARLTRAPGEVPLQRAPVLPLADNAAPLQRRDRATKTPSAIGTPATTTECDRKLIDMTDQVRTCQENLSTLRAELAKVLQNNSEETASLRREIAKGQANLQELQASKNEIAGELAGLRQKIELMQGNLNEFEGQLREAGKTKSKLETERDKLEREIVTLTADNVENKARITENLGRIAGLRRQVEAASAQERTLQEQYSKMQSELLAAQSSVADLNSRFATTDGLIRAADEQIRADLAKISKTLGEGVEQITDGIQYLVGLADDTRSDIAKTRTGFTEQFSALQRELARTELARRGEILQAIQSLKVENQESMAALQRDLAAASAEKDRLQTQLSQEQAAKAMAEGQVAAKNEEIARKAQENATALQAARQAAADTAQEVKAANDRALEAKDAESAATAARLEMAYRGHLDVLSRQLAAAIARGDAAEASVAELARVREEIARLRVPAPLAPPPPAPAAPVITGREPAGEVTTGTNIAIQWNNNGTPSPWILRVDYDGANPDFQEVTDSAPIKYTIKRPGALSGRIYSVTVV